MGAILNKLSLESYKEFRCRYHVVPTSFLGSDSTSEVGNWDENEQLIRRSAASAARGQPPAMRTTREGEPGSQNFSLVPGINWRVLNAREL